MISLCDGVEIGYDDVGTGIPVALVHGFPHNRTLWAPQVSALVDRARCIAPDLRGFGESSKHGPFTIDQFADDVAMLLRELGVERAVIAGLSMGGYVAFALWRRHRALVRGLVLADTKAGADSDETREKRRALVEIARTRGAGAVADGQITGMIGKTTREKRPALSDEVHRMLASASVDGIVGALEAMMARVDSTDTLATIDVPTLIVVGSEDALTPKSEAEILHDAIRGSRLEVIEQAGHVSNMERPAAFNHVLSEFLAGLEYA
ncbi:MAG TPA: alpha/beta fold hydrolase [Gemmatimonadaceae bacterium]|nr:alpha/beta fold hydrolase [Gemmatimonadaceae bacterium]